MILSLELFEALLNKQMKVSVIVIPSPVFPDQVKVIRPDKKKFIPQQREVLTKYARKNTIKNWGCYHFLVEPDLLGSGCLRVGKNI